MPGDVIDIVQRLTYEANTGGLDKAYEAIERNIKSIAQNAESIQRLEALKARVDANDINRINQITVAIENRRKKITQETQDIGRQIQVNDKLKVSLLNTFGTYNTIIQKQGQLAKSSNTATFALTDLGRVAQDLPFGFIGIQNNIVPLVERFGQLVTELGSTRAAFTALKSSLIGVGGLGFAFSIVTSALTYYALSSQGAEKETRDLSKEIEDATDNLEKFLDKLNESRERPSIFTKDETAELRRQIQVLREKSGTEAEVFGLEQKLTDQQIANLNRRKQAFEALKTLPLNLNDVREAREQLREALPFATQKQADDIFNQVTKGASLFKVASERITEIESEIADKRADIQANANRRQRTLQDEAEEANKKALDKAREQAEAYQKILDTFRKATFNDPSEVDKIEKDFADRAKATRQGLKELGQSFREGLEDELGGGISDEASRALNEQLTLQARQKKQKEDDDKKQKERTEKNVKEAVSAYQTLEVTIAAILDRIYEKQIRLLDLELDKRRNNIEYAVELAERGNVELLNAERERIRQLEAEREKAAARQLQANAVLAVSNSALAVTQAIRGVLTAATTTAEEGGGIIGFIASLIAGAAAVGGLYASLKNVGEGFKDGVVDLEGPGTSKSDSIPARLSKGESVITAEATAKYKPMLEAMNAGIPIAYTAPYPQSAQAANYINLEKKMDNLVEAVNNIHYSSENRVDEHGVYQLQKTTLKSQRRRWGQ